MSMLSAVLPTPHTPAASRKIHPVLDELTRIDLKRREMITLLGDHRHRIVICREGMLWITQAYDPDDYVLHAGESFLVTLPGRVVIQALMDSSLEISSPMIAHPFKGNLEYSA